MYTFQSQRVLQQCQHKEVDWINVCIELKTHNCFFLFHASQSITSTYTALVLFSVYGHSSSNCSGVHLWFVGLKSFKTHHLNSQEHLCKCNLIQWISHVALSFQTIYNEVHFFLEDVDEFSSFLCFFLYFNGYNKGLFPFICLSSISYISTSWFLNSDIYKPTQHLHVGISADVAFESMCSLCHVCLYMCLHGEKKRYYCESMKLKPSQTECDNIKKTST